MAQPSAVDVIGQAFRHTRAQLWPFRWSQWWRIGLLGLAAGEFGGGSGGGAGNGNAPSGSPSFPGMGDFDFLQPAVLFWIATGVAVVVLLWLLVVYVNSVCRFVLIESIVRKEAGSLRAGWRKWRQAGRRFFAWQLAFQASALTAIALVIGVPCFLAYRAGWFSAAEDHGAELIWGGVAIVMAILALLFVAGIVYVLAKDFVAPIMAVEGVGAAAAWRHLLAMMRAEKGGFLGYFLLKFILTIVVAILMLTVVLLVLSPLILLAIGAVGTGGAVWSSGTIGTLIGFGVTALVMIVVVAGLASVPLAVFFPACGLYFLGPRFPALGQWMAEAQSPAA